MIDYKSVRDIKDLIADISENEWGIFYMHGIHPSGKLSAIYGDETVRDVLTPSELSEIIQHAIEQGVKIVGLNEGLQTYVPEHFYKKCQ